MFFHQLLASLGAQLSAVPRQSPPLPNHFVERPEEEEQIKEYLLSKEKKAGTLSVISIYGLAGLGKSTLVLKLARDADIQQGFSDGILWATLGQNPDILPLLSDWIQELGDFNYKPAVVDSASNHLRTLLYDKRILLVVDDVWNPDHLKPFLVGGEGSCVLVTTRECRISATYRYEMSVMSPEQSLALVTQKLSEPLSGATMQQAQSFAERIGHLPLALELAASQIEGGMTWYELTEAFQAEVARLEVLDVCDQAEMPDDEKRREYSLLACFNLSLRRLSQEQLGYFAWLGVVYEDASLTREMTETLWQVASHESGVILRTFKSRSLIMQGAKQVNGRPSYRIHDLMHDLAQRLLTSSPQPQNSIELPGMGFTKAGAHSELLERYRRKTRGGQWHTLKSDDYIHAHLTWHMERAEQPQAIHQLLQVSNESGCNGWYEACNTIGRSAGFISDVGRAWRLAVLDYEQSPSETIVLLSRYTIIRASLNSLESNMSAELVAALIDKKIWQPAQGLAYAQQVQNPEQRGEFIVAIVPHIPEALISPCFKTICRIKNARYRSYVLSKLAERFPKFWPDTLTVIQEIQDYDVATRREELGFSSKAVAISSIIDHLPHVYYSQALKIAHQIQNIIDRVTALVALSSYIPSCRTESLSLVRKISDSSSCSLFLCKLAQQMPELWVETLNVTQSIGDELNRSHALSQIAPFLSKGLMPKALSIVKEMESVRNRAFSLGELIPHLPEELLCRSLAAVRDIHEIYRFSALGALAVRMPELWPELLKVTRIGEIEHAWAYALKGYAQYIPIELLSNFLKAIEETQTEHSRVIALREIAPYMSRELLSEALKVAMKIRSNSQRSSAFAALSPFILELLPQAIAAMPKSIAVEFNQAFISNVSISHLPKNLLLQKLSTTKKINDKSDQANLICGLAPQLPKLWSEALTAISNIRNSSTRADALYRIIPNLPMELSVEALTIARGIEDLYSKLRVLGQLAEYLPAEMFLGLLNIGRNTSNESVQANILESIVEHLPTELFPQVLFIVKATRSESARFY